MKRIFTVLISLIQLSLLNAVNYVSWDFTPSITNANYSTSIPNQTGARTTDLVGATLSTITIVGGAVGAAANTLHRTTTWPTASAAGKYLEFSVQLPSSNSFPNIAVSLAIAAQVSSITTAARDYQIQYGWGSSPTFQNATNGAVTGVGTTTSSNSATIPAPGNTTTKLLTIRILIFGSTSSTGNMRLASVALTGDAVLSVDLKSIIASKNKNSNIISWQTATEKNNAQFQIERSQNGEVFSKIGEVKGRGNSNVEQNYTYTDASPVKGINYYRLRQVDFDGTESVSKTVSVNFDGKGQNSVKAFPSLTHDLVNVELSGEGKSEISVRDLTGRIILTKNTEGVSFTTLNLADLSNGLYIMSVRSNEVTESLKIQKY